MNPHNFLRQQRIWLFGRQRSKNALPCSIPIPKMKKYRKVKFKQTRQYKNTKNIHCGDSQKIYNIIGMAIWKNWTSKHINPAHFNVHLDYSKEKGNQIILNICQGCRFGRGRIMLTRDKIAVLKRCEENSYDFMILLSESIYHFTCNTWTKYKWLTTQLSWSKLTTYALATYLNVPKIIAI